MLAPGEKGLVMVCFTLPSFDVVFKLIRDKFPVQKNILREDVLQKYELVFKHDRAGRLVDAQEFKRIKFPKARFAPDLLHELLTETAATVHDEGDQLAHRPPVHRATHDPAQPVRARGARASRRRRRCSTTARRSATSP